MGAAQEYAATPHRKTQGIPCMESVLGVHLRLLSDQVAYHQIGNTLQVLVRDNNVDQALRVLKKKMQREGIFREMKRRAAYEKPSERKVREKAEAIRRARKAARKQAQRDGLLPAPKRREPTGSGMVRPRP